MIFKEEFYGNLYLHYVICTAKIRIMESIGVGLASYGMSGQVFHGPLLHVNQDFRIISILERSKNVSASHFPDAHIIRSYKELLDNDQIELIVVNTPDQFHYEMTRNALLAGKHVVVEKPFVQESIKGQELIDLATQWKRLFSVFHSRRFDGDFLTLRDILDKSYLGRLVEYEAHFDRYRNFIQEGTWKEDPESGTGILFNLGSHLIDQALQLFGTPVYVTADIRTQREDCKIDDAFTIWLGYDAVKVTLKASYLVREPGPRYQLNGTKGSYQKFSIDPQEDQLKAGKWPVGDDWGREHETDWGTLNTDMDDGHFQGKYETLPGDYRLYYANIFAAIRDGRDLLVTADDANQVIRVIEAAMKSNRSGNRVAFTG